MYCENTILFTQLNASWKFSTALFTLALKSYVYDSFTVS